MSAKHNVQVYQDSSGQWTWRCVPCPTAFFPSAGSVSGNDWEKEDEARSSANKHVGKLVSPSWWCRWFGCKKTGPYYGMVQSHCWNCGMKTGYANPALNLPDFVTPAAKRSK